MRACLPLLAMIWVASVALASDEPPTRLRVEIDGTSHVLAAGATHSVVVDGRTLRLRVEELPWRQFHEGSLRFDYPRHMSWEFDASPPRSWVLDGNDAVLSVFDNAGQAATPAQAASELARHFRMPEAGTTPARLRTAKTGTLRGVAITIKLATTALGYEYYAVSKDDAAWLLVLQGTLDDHGAHSAEFRAMRERLADTLEF